ncbi:MAG: hypothetical protein JO138_04975 [Acidobacteriaceae bacterium]|nr:hypothetical protein [Acidobacteriaceae bacterium]
MGKTVRPPVVFRQAGRVPGEVATAIGQIKILKFNALTPPAFQIFMHSFDMAEPDYGRAAQRASENKLRLANLNFDIGSMTHAGQYDPQDDAYEFWVDELARLHYATVTTAMVTTY